MTIDSVSSGLLSCNCGCGKAFPLFTGLMRYGHGHSFAFRVAHLAHKAHDAHLWLLLGSGAWFNDDPRGCWITLHSWVSPEGVVGKIEEPEASPFTDEHVFRERRLTRSEVLSQNGALEWAIDRRDELLSHHPPSYKFFLGALHAQQFAPTHLRGFL